MASTAGSGHFGPLVPFADACRRAGHEVLVAGPASLGPAVARVELAFWACDDLPEDEWRAVMARLPGLSHDEANAVVVGEVFGRLDTRTVLPRILAAFEDRRPDVVVRETCEFGSYLASERFGIPHARVGVGLGSLEEWSLPVVAPSLADLGASMGLDADAHVANIRSSPYLTLAPPSFEDPGAPGLAHAARLRDTWVDVAPDAALPPWWPDDRDRDPLVYVTFGSVTAGLGPLASIYGVVVGALADLPVRVLVTTGTSGDPSGLDDLPPNVHVERWVPQALVIPHAAAIVCHGGFGTVLGGLVAGVPEVVVPLFADQPQNARRVADLGAGIAVEGAPPDPEVVRQAVVEVLGQPSYRVAARRVAEEANNLPPVESAVDVLEALAAGGRPHTGPY